MERSRTSSEISSWGPLKEDATTSEEFCRIIIEHAGQPRTKDYINDNVGTCNSRVDHLAQDMKKYQFRGSVREHGGALAIQSEIRNERSTWTLLQSLAKPDRVDRMENDGEFFSHRATAERIIEENDDIRRHLGVVRWLEIIYSENLSLLESGDASARHTLRHLQDVRMKDKQSLVATLDPDSASREGKRLHPQDNENENKLLKFLWDCIRAGNYQKAEELCRNYHQWWRAASIGGGSLWHDDGGVPTGNRTRFLWKKTCSDFAEKSQNEFERGIYGILGGNLPRVLPLLRSWEDYCWAYFKHLAELNLDRLLYGELTARKGYDDIQFSGENFDQAGATPEAIFAKLDHSDVRDISESARSAYHTVQKYLILGDTVGVLRCLVEKVAGETCPPSFKRFAVHLYLVLNPNCPENDATDDGIAIITAYVDHLQNSKEFELVAPYCALLPPQNRRVVYTDFLKSLADARLRSHYQTVAGNFMPNEAKEIAIMVVDEICADIPDVSVTVDGVGEVALTADDRNKIDAIKTLIEENLLPDLIAKANELFRGFVQYDHLEACAHLLKEGLGEIELMKKIEEIIKQFEAELGSDTRGNSRGVNDRIYKIMCLKAELFEFTCWKLFVLGYQCRNAWFKHSAIMPKKPEKPRFRSEADGKRFDDILRAYRADLRDWQRDNERIINNARGAIADALCVDSGWLKDDRCIHGTGERSKIRREFLHFLKRKSIPNMVYWLFSLLFESDLFADCVQMAPIVYGEKWGNYRWFTQSQLEKLREKFGDCEKKAFQR